MTSPAGLLALLLLVSVTGLVEGQVFQVRLMNRTTDTTALGRGRVEVLTAAGWGTVCDDTWDDIDAVVVCRMLGLPGSATAVISSSVYGPGTLPLMLDNIVCPSGAVHLNSCSSTGNTNCISNNEDAGVNCNVTFPPATTPLSPLTTTPANTSCPPYLRLASHPGAPFGMGIVELQHPTTGAWGTVCDDLWDVHDAEVVCRMCNYHLTHPSFWYPRPGGQGVDLTGASSLPLHLDDVQCLGTESDVRSCPHAPWGTHNCNDNEKAAVSCIHLNSSAKPPPRPGIDCSNDFMAVSFSRAYDPNLQARHLTVNPPSGCSNASISVNSTHVNVRIPLRGCNMSLTQNATHIIYGNIIRYDYTNVTGIITYVNDYLINVRCELNRTANLTRSYTPLTEVVNVSAAGQYNLTMKFFLNDSFTQEDPRLPLPIAVGERLNVAINLLSDHDNVELIVHNCWATPVPPAVSAISRNIMVNNCREEPTLRIFPLNHTTFGFRFQTFKFTASNIIHVNCDAFVCLRYLNTSDCDQSCNSAKPTPNYPISVGRRRRDVSPSTPAPIPVPRFLVTSPPVYVYLPGQQGDLSPHVNSANAASGATAKATAQPGPVPTEKVLWQWAPGQAGEVTPGPLPQAGEATPAATWGREPPQTGEGGRAASQGGAELSLQSPVLVLEPPGGAACPAAVVSLGPLLLLLSVSVFCVSGLLL